MDDEADCSDGDNDDSEPVPDSQVALLIDDTPLVSDAQGGVCAHNGLRTGPLRC